MPYSWHPSLAPLYLRRGTLTQQIKGHHMHACDSITRNIVRIRWTSLLHFDAPCRINTSTMSNSFDEPDVFDMVDTNPIQARLYIAMSFPCYLLQWRKSKIFMRAIHLRNRFGNHNSEVVLCSQDFLCTYHRRHRKFLQDICSI